GVEVMIAHAAGSHHPGVLAGQPDVWLHEGVDLVGKTVNVDTLGLSPKTSGHLFPGYEGARLNTSTLAEIDGFCKFTNFASYILPNDNHDKVDLYFPKLSLVNEESMVDLTPNGVGTDVGIGIDTDGNRIRETDWHIYVASMLLCDDVMTNVVFLGKP